MDEARWCKENLMPYMWNDDDALTTSSYRGGTLCIYSGPKRPKSRPPVYGFKFVQTEKAKKRKSVRRGTK